MGPALSVLIWNNTSQGTLLFFDFLCPRCTWASLSKMLYRLAVAEIRIFQSPFLPSLTNTNIQLKQESIVPIRRLDHLSSFSYTTYQIIQWFIDLHCNNSLPPFTLLSIPLNTIPRNSTAPVCLLPSTPPHGVLFCTNIAAGLWKSQWTILLDTR